MALVTGCTMDRFTIFVALHPSDSRHNLALSNVVGHKFLGQNVQSPIHGLHGDRSMQMKWQSDNHSFDGIVIEQCLNSTVTGIINLDALSSLGFACIFVLLNQTWTSCIRGR